MATVRLGHLRAHLLGCKRVVVMLDYITIRSMALRPLACNALALHELFEEGHGWSKPGRESKRYNNCLITGFGKAAYERTHRRPTQHVDQCLCRLSPIVHSYRIAEHRDAHHDAGTLTTRLSRWRAVASRRGPSGSTATGHRQALSSFQRRAVRRCHSQGVPQRSSQERQQSRESFRGC